MVVCLCRPFGTCSGLLALPRTYVRGYPMPSLRDWGLVVLCHVFSSKFWGCPQRLKPQSIGGPLRGAEAPLFHGAARVLLVPAQSQNQRQDQGQRRRTGVSDPHEPTWVPRDSHRFIFPDVQITLLPVLERGYWSRGFFRCGCEQQVPHPRFARVRNDKP
jgi:hypothetical protein